MKNKILVYGSVLLGIVFVIIAFVYFSHSAGTLPQYMPGYEAGSTHIHFKHGLGSIIIGIALFIFAWFKSGEKSSN